MTDYMTRVIAAYREDVDTERVVFNPLTMDRYLRLRAWLSMECDHISTHVFGAGGAGFTVGYVRGLRAAEADMEYVSIYEGKTFRQAAAACLDYVVSGLTPERLLDLFGVDAMQSEGFVQGYKALLAHTTHR